MADGAPPTYQQRRVNMSQSTKRACDACHRRKVRCDSRQPCRNCHTASLSCTYNAIPQKKGPKGNRAKVISELRDKQHAQNVSLRFQRQFSGEINTPPETPPTSAFQPALGGLLSHEIISSCVAFFFENMYPTMPILHQPYVEDQVRRMDHCVEDYCLITALCAFMMIQPGIRIPSQEHENVIEKASNMRIGQAFLAEALRVRKTYDFVEDPSISTIITSFFFFGCYFGLDRHNTAWFYLREATTLTQIIGMGDEETYTGPDLIERCKRRRLFWLLFVTERAYALQRHHPLTLHPTINLPRLDDDPSETVAISGFLHLVSLFRPFDDMFVGLWNKTRADCSTAWLGQLQRQLNDALPAQLNSTENQAADLRTSQHWLRTMVWDLSIRNGFLSSTSSDDSMTFKYPLMIARDLVAVTGQLSQQSMEVHGIGLIEKIFDVACTLTDVMSCVPLEENSFEVGPREVLNQCMKLVSTLRGGDSRFLPLLLDKVTNETPIMAPPIVSGLPFEPDTRVTEVFDSSGSEGMHDHDTPEEIIPLTYDDDFAAVAAADLSYPLPPAYVPQLVMHPLDFADYHYAP